MDHLHTQFRRATIEDASAISDLIIRNINYFHIDHYTANEIEIWERGYSTVEVEHQINGRAVFVLVLEDEQICGTVQVDGSEIKGFYIDPKFAGLGLGSRLNKAIINYLKEKGIYNIELTSNKWMIGFYEKQGFKLLGKETVFWEDQPFTEFRMIKNIPPKGTTGDPESK